jgi:hypothetical protein
MQDDIDIGVHDEYWDEAKEDGMTETEFGKEIVDMMHEGLGRKRRA